MIILTADFLSEKYTTMMFHGERVLSLIEIALSFINKKTLIFPINNRNDSVHFDRNKFYMKSGINPSLIHKKNFKIDDINDDSINYVKDFFGEKFVIGYELQELTKKVLEKVGVSYINIWLSPIRFMEDEIFMIESNILSIRNKIKSFEIDKFLFYSNAKYIEIMIKNRYKSLQLEKNSCALFGQTDADKTLRTNTGHLNLLSYKKEIINLSKKFNKIYFLEHPLNKNNKTNDNFIMSLPGVEKLSCNSYQILCNKNITTVATISSSIAVEAYFFRKNVIIFNKITCDIMSPQNISIDGCIFSYHFWKYILDDGEFKYITPLPRQNAVRNIMNAYYAYEIIQKP